MNDASQRSSVVVIGGGYAGINVARALDDHAHVTLVEPKDAFVHNVAAMRALVEPTWVPRIFLPYDHLLEHGTVVRDRATHVTANRVVLASGQRLTPDFIVLATGSTYPFPAKSDQPNTAHLRQRRDHACRCAVHAGGGPVDHEHHPTGRLPPPIADADAFADSSP